MADTVTLAEGLVVALGLAGGVAIVVLTFQGYRRTGQGAMAWLSAGFVLLTAGLFLEHFYVEYLHRPPAGMSLLHLPGVVGFLCVLVSAWKSRAAPPSSPAQAKED